MPSVLVDNAHSTALPIGVSISLVRNLAARFAAPGLRGATGNPNFDFKWKAASTGRQPLGPPIHFDRILYVPLDLPRLREQLINVSQFGDGEHIPNPDPVEEAKVCLPPPALEFGLNFAGNA